MATQTETTWDLSQGVLDADTVMVNLGTGVITGEDDTEWSIDELEAMVAALKEQAEKWAKLIPWLKSMPN